MSDELVDDVREALDPTPAHEAEWPVSRRQVLQGLAASGALALGPGGVAGAAGTVSADQAFFSNYNSTSTASGYDVTIDDDVFAFDGDDTIGLPDGAQGTELVTPSGASASEVIGPDGRKVFVAIPDSEVFHYDATVLSLSDGDKVSSWGDESGNGHGLSGSGATYKTGAQNGNSVVRFDGTDDYLEQSSSSLTQPNTVIIVNQGNGSISTDGRWVLTHDGSGDRQIFQHPRGDEFDAGGWQMFAGNSNEGPHGEYDNQWHLHLGIFDDTSSQYYLDGTAYDASDVGAQGLNGLRLGSAVDGSKWFDGDVGEVIGYDRELSSSEISDVEDYLSDKWSITI